LRAKRIIVRPLAELDLYEAAAFLNKRSPGKGEELVDAFTRTIELLRRFPSAGSPFRDGFRRRAIPRWHHSIVYTETRAAIFVIAVIDDARGPRHWRKRVK
jgi:plasmid stabilization system protein ParE